jgi:hypothetical protein
LQVERYLIIMQNQAADSRAAFSRLMEEQDGRLVLPNESLSARGRDIPLGDYISSSRSGHHNRSHSNHRRHSPSSSRSPRSPDYIRPLPLTLPRRPPSPPLRSPLGVEDGRWHAAERGDRSPPYKRRRASGRDEFQPGVRVFIFFKSKKAQSRLTSPPGAPRPFVTATRIHRLLPPPRLAIDTIPSVRAIRPANTCPRHQRPRAPSPFGTDHQRRYVLTMRGIPRSNLSHTGTRRCRRVPSRRPPPRKHDSPGSQIPRRISTSTVFTSTQACMARDARCVLGRTKRWCLRWTPTRSRMESVG